MSLVSARLSRSYPPATPSVIALTNQTNPPRSWSAHGVDGPIRPDASVTVEPLEGGTRSRITFTLDFEGHGIGVPILPLVRKQARKAVPVSYRNLQRLLEGRTV